MKLARHLRRGWAVAPADLARTHLWSIVAHVWPGAAICDRSALAGGVVDGWLFICHPDPPRRSDLRLPGVGIACRVGPGRLPGDMPWLEEGLVLAGTARGLVENVSPRPPPEGSPAASRRPGRGR